MKPPSLHRLLKQTLAEHLDWHGARLSLRHQHSDVGHCLSRDCHSGLLEAVAASGELQHRRAHRPPGAFSDHLWPGAHPRAVGGS